MKIDLQTQLPSFADLLLDALFLVDAGGRVEYVNAACERIFGYTPEEMIGRELRTFLVPEDRERTAEEARRVLAGQPRVGFENRFVRKDGRQVTVMWSARWSEADRLRIGVARDVTVQKHTERMQAAVYAVSEAAHLATDLETLFREIHRIVADLVPVDGLAVATCKPESKLLGFDYLADNRGQRPPGHLTMPCPHCNELCGGGQSALVRDQTLAADGDPWLAMPLVAQNEAVGVLFLRGAPGTVYSDGDKELLRFVSAQIATAMERALLKAELLRSARHDELTGLPNRRLFHERAAAALARSRRRQRTLALLYVDLDGFKQVNDAHGHAAGDTLLRASARRLAGCIRAEDTAARLGGDEFVVMIEDVREAEEAAAVADKIRAALAGPVDVGGSLLRVRASIGVALFPDHGDDAEALLRHADAGMYRDKRDSRRPAGTSAASPETAAG